MALMNLFQQEVLKRAGLVPETPGLSPERDGLVSSPSTDLQPSLREEAPAQTLTYQPYSLDDCEDIYASPSPPPQSNAIKEGLPIDSDSNATQRLCGLGQSAELVTESMVTIKEEDTETGEQPTQTISLIPGMKEELSERSTPVQLYDADEDRRREEVLLAELKELRTRRVRMNELRKVDGTAGLSSRQPTVKREVTPLSVYFTPGEVVDLSIDSDPDDGWRRKGLFTLDDLSRRGNFLLKIIQMQMVVFVLYIPEEIVLLIMPWTTTSTYEIKRIYYRNLTFCQSHI